MRYLTIIALLFSSVLAQGQFVFSTSYHDFGEIKKGDQTWFDFEVSNASDKPIYLLRADEPYAVKVLYSKKKLLPDSTAFIRIKYTPMKKGKFKKDVPVWVSSNNEPITFTLEGTALYEDKKEDWACPDFRTKRQPVSTNFPWTVKVINKKTKAPIRNAKVEVIWDGLVYKTYNTNRDGITKNVYKQEMYYVVASKSGFKGDESDFFLYKQATQLVLELDPMTEDEIAAADTVPVVPEPIDSVKPVPEDTLPKEALPRNEFAPNNVVFLIDISVSMKQKGRLDLLKASMIELLNMLRDIDRFSLVTYASTTEIVLDGVPGNQKQEAIQAIQDLEAGGYTAGAKGIKKAYQVANKHKIEDGNNQVIISTDGAFNVSSSSGNILRDVEKNAEKGVTISVVGVKNEKWTAKSMKEISDAGKGQYINIQTYSQAKESLVDEIKSNSRINRN